MAVEPQPPESKILNAIIGKEFNDQKTERLKLAPCHDSSSGLSICTVLYALNVVCFLVIFMQIRYQKNKRKHNDNKSVNLDIWIYFQKLSLMNLLSGTVATAVAYWLTKHVAVIEDVITTSVYVSEFDYIFVLTICATAGANFTRYFSFGVAQPDQYQIQQQAAPAISSKKKKSKANLQPVQPQIKDPKTQAFITALQTFFGYAVVMTGAAILFIVLLNQYDYEYEICVPSDLIKTKYRYMFLFMITVSVCLCCLISDVALSERDGSDFFGKILAKPFFTTTVFSTNFAWLFVAFIMYRYNSPYAVEYTLIWAVFALLDQGWLFVFTSATAVSNTSMKV